MRRGAPPVEEAGFREHENAGADRSDAPREARQTLDLAEQLSVAHGDARAGIARDDQRVDRRLDRARRGARQNAETARAFDRSAPHRDDLGRVAGALVPKQRRARPGRTGEAFRFRQTARELGFGVGKRR